MLEILLCTVIKRIEAKRPSILLDADRFNARSLGSLNITGNINVTGTTLGNEAFVSTELDSTILNVEDIATSCQLLNPIGYADKGVCQPAGIKNNLTLFLSKPSTI